MTDRIMIIGGRRESLEMLERAKAAGIDVIYVQHPAAYRAEMADYAKCIVLFDFQDLGTLVEMAKGLFAAFPFRTAISLSEDGLLPAAHVNDALGLEGNPLETVLVLKNKFRMRNLLNARGLSPVAAAIVKSREGIDEFVAKQGFPVIVKPIDGAGSIAVFRLNGQEDVELALRRTRELGVEELLIEEFLDGHEISVETFTFDGKHVVIAITDKTTNEHHVEVGHCVPTRLTSQAANEITALITRFLDAVGLVQGPAHTELMLTKKGPRIIESHDRTGGDRINEIVRIAYDVDMKAMAMAWTCRKIPPLSQSPAPLRGAAIRFLTPHPGVVTAVRGEESLRTAKGCEEVMVSVAVGSRIGAADSSGQRAGHVIARGKNAEAAEARCAELLAQIQIETTEGSSS